MLRNLSGQIVSGIVGIDLPGDIRDLTCTLTQWEFSWEHTGKTGLKAVVLIPAIRALKYSGKVDNLIKATRKFKLQTPAGLRHNIV